MENRNEFSLNQNITVWKSKLLKSSGLTNDNVEELESHLLDEIQSLQKLGLNDEESFLVAAKRMGDNRVLIEEFSKVNRGIVFRRKIIPYLKGVLSFIAFLAIAELMVNITVLFGQFLNFNETQLKWFTIGLFCFLGISPFLGYVLFKRGKFKLSNTANIPYLVYGIIIAKALNFFALIFLARHVSSSTFGKLRFNFGYFEITFLVFILTIAVVMSIQLKKDAKLKFGD